MSKPLTPAILAKASKAAMRAFAAPTPAPLPPAPLPTHPLALRWALKGMELSPTRNRYFIALPLPYIGVLQECGEPLTLTRHILEIYLIPNGATIVSDAVQDKRPIARLLTSPFYFHNSDDAIQAINQALPEISELL